MQRVLALGSILVASAPAAAQEPFRVVNRTGQQVMELNAVRSPRGAANAGTESDSAAAPSRSFKPLCIDRSHILPAALMP